MEARESIEAATFGSRFGPTAHSIHSAQSIRSVANARPPAGKAEPTAGPSAPVDHINYKSIVRYATATPQNLKPAMSAIRHRTSTDGGWRNNPKKLMTKRN